MISDKLYNKFCTARMTVLTSKSFGKRITKTKVPNLLFKEDVKIKYHCVIVINFLKGGSSGER